MTTIAFLGTGLMGTGFIQRARANGLTVRAWNRSAAKAQALAANDAAGGVTACATVAQAVQGAERIHLSLSDDASVDAVLEPLAGVLPAGAWVVDHTTTAVRPTAERVARWDARGVRYVHAPVFMAPANCAEGTGWMLISGDPARHQALQGALQAMTGKVIYLGPQPERAAAFKLFGNLTLLGILGILGDVGRLAAAVGIDMKDAFSLFEHFNPGQTLPQRAKRISAGQYSPPSFEMSMTRKDLRLMIEEAARGGQTLVMMPALAKLLDEGIQRGEGHLDVAAGVRVPKP
ncbi:MAG TPA: NAD(P)-binding domain-containing protein [Burkholderiaceae bacterium]|nr:NAD(P)-binding domain-containing protein [Burkholderiaceae bacterium]